MASKIEKLIQKLCPDGVEYKPLWALTTWDKKFNGVQMGKQPHTVTFSHVDAKTLKAICSNSGDIKLLSTGNFDGFTNEDMGRRYINCGEVIAIPSGGMANIKYWSGLFIDSGNILAISSNISLYDLKYIYYYLLKCQGLIQNYYRGSGIQHPDMSAILDIRIPVPPLEIQKEIVKVLDNFTNYSTELQTELQARIKQYACYHNKLLSYDSLISSSKQIEWCKLGKIGKVRMCKRILKSQTQSSGIPFFKIGTFGKKEDAYISEELFCEYKNKYSYPKKGDILISAAGTIGRTIIFNGEPAYFQDSNIVWLENDEKKVLNRYLYYFYKTSPWKISTGGTVARIYNENIEDINIPVPSKETQEHIIRILDTFDAICSGIKSGLPAEISARRKQYEYYRNALLTFKEKA